MEQDASARVSERRPDTIHSRTQLYARAVQIVEREHGSSIEIDDLASRLATSRRQLQRAFAEIGRTTFRQHLMAVRLTHAAALLTDPSLTIGAIAQRVGYRQQAQFTRSFHRHHGSLPSDYRRERLRHERRRSPATSATR